ncbi:class I SAM-dependent methyltransferase [Prolixibacteraceae bacterium Z1-6]|uniref:Class I SAM-dependent methyltransferase n=1 Tax=Draconibacterium aestuarii TaxID=2998507 RepID=A0A9X3J733_9BACT|nr:class I SAM-dependent methyltransferase [Prolixibacteraceae bacterium Z1-6]
MEEIVDRKKHWEQIYATKNTDDVSWYQPHPTVSLEFVKEFKIPKSEKIIDVGGGDSLLVDHLIELGYNDITVLDISEAALKKAKQRLGDKASKVNWIVADAATFQPTEKYGFWHDRAAFHFLTNDNEIKSYITTIQQNLKPDGVLVIGTFSENGPTKCSGIEIKQYSETSMTERLKRFFEKVKCITVDHKTPFESIQNFIFCSFRRLAVES